MKIFLEAPIINDFENMSQSEQIWISDPQMGKNSEDLKIRKSEKYLNILDFVGSNPIQFDSIRFNRIQSDAIRSNPIQSDLIRFNSIQSDPIQSDPIRFEFSFYFLEIFLFIYELSNFNFKGNKNKHFRHILCLIIAQL